MGRSFQPARPRGGTWGDFFAFLSLWLAFAGAALLLSWFVSVLNDVMQRGEQRRVQRLSNGALVVADEPRQALHVLTSADDTLKQRP